MKEFRLSGNLDFQINDISYVRISRAGGFALRHKMGKERFSLVLTVKGRMRYTFPNDGMELVAEEGAMCLIPKNYPYGSDYEIHETEIQLLLFDIDLENTPELLSTPKLIVDPEIMDAFRVIDGVRKMSPMFLAGRIYEILSLVDGSDDRLPEKYGRIAPAIAEINKYYFESKKTGYYAELCNMSESNFRKTFRECIGKSPIEYRNILRIFEAKKLLDSGAYTATEVAYITGFNNMSFFYEMLKRYSDAKH